MDAEGWQPSAGSGVLTIGINWFLSFSRNRFGTEIGAPAPSPYPLCYCLPTPFPPRQAVPKGLCENSPAFQRREKVPEISSPAGTVETSRNATQLIFVELKSGSVSRPCGTCCNSNPIPALKRRAIVGCPSGTEIRRQTSEHRSVNGHLFSGTPFRVAGA